MTPTLLSLDESALLAYNHLISLLDYLESSLSLAAASPSKLNEDEASSSLPPDPTFSIYAPSSLAALLKTISSPFPLDHLAREVIGTITSHNDEASLQAAFFALLGESSFEAMISIFENVGPIREGIKQLGADTYSELCAQELVGTVVPRSRVDEAEANAATLMAVARAADEQSR